LCNIFEFTFIDADAKGPDPAALGYPLLGDGHGLGFAGRISIEINTLAPYRPCHIPEQIML
jgi:hypothetical protein